MLLERFVWAKAAEVRALRAAGRQGTLPTPFAGTRPSFTAALRRGAAADGLAIIAEYKRASPSRGLMCADVPPEAAALDYAAAGASCLSVLTEEKYFSGSLDFVNRAAAALAAEIAPAGGDVLPCAAGETPSPLPLLRKDFIFSAEQVAATAATRASALLLIVRMTPQVALLRALREQAEAAGMEAVVEVFDAADLRLARASGARLIQVNARDLDSLRVDREACVRLAEQYPPQAGECWIAASGIDSAEQLLAVADAGFSAALIGSAFMQGGRPGAALASLRERLAAMLAQRQGISAANGRAARPAPEAADAGISAVLHPACTAATATAAVREA